MHTASFRRAAGAVGLGALVAGGLIAVPAPATANPAGTALVISEVFGGGGNGGATWTHDFVELHNPTGSSITVDGMSVQYRSSGGSSAFSGVTPLSGSVPAGGHYLVQQAVGSGGSKALPTPDATGTIAMSGSSGTVALVQGTTAITLPAGDNRAVSGVLDLVGFGTSNTFETAPTGVALTSTTSAARAASGADTDHNADDFGEGAPSPTNAAGETEPPDTGGGEPVEATIAEVQGTTDTSPLEGESVITDGVVTAAYPTGGFNGFYLQTGGPDTTPGASDGVFVHGPDFDESTLQIGDTVTVTGDVSEFNGLTEITADTVEDADTVQPPVQPNTALPGTDCALPGTDCPDATELDALREELEGEAFLPDAPMTVTDSYDFGVTSSSFFGEIGIAAGSQIPLVTPTEVVDAQDTAGIAARTSYNRAHLVVLDDGSSTNYWNTSNTAAGQDQPVPWLTPDHTVRVGAAVTFEQPAILDYRFGWKLQPQRQVVGKPAGLVTFEQDRPQAPAAVGGDLRLATFNVLNYFTTLGGDVAGCTAYVDRDDNPIATRSCSADNGPRGAWDAANLQRQQDKIVKAINTMDADVVSLEELENSRTVDGGDRDEALATLVGALNAAAGETRWAYAPSPSVLPATEDVIRTGFIYRPATTELVGDSQILDVAAFDNARDPLAQVFRAKGAADPGFAVIANHFKSKGSGVDDGTGQGNANPDRVAQAEALVSFASSFAAARGTDKVFLTGDFNAYSMEDPVQVIEAAGFTSLESTDDPDEESYSFAGTSGSLDHVFANAAAKSTVTGMDVWEINANESVFYQYSRYNYVGTLLYAPDVFASSDHNPEVVGIKAPKAPQPGTRTLEAFITPKAVVVNRTRAMVHVKVGRSDGARAAGTVEVREGGTLLASQATQGNGVANIRLPKFTETGEHTLTVRYVEAPGTVVEKSLTVSVTKAASAIRVSRARAAKGKVATLVVKVRDADLGKAVGKVKVKAVGTWRKATLRKGRATVRLGRYRSTGKKRVVVQYLGSSSAERERRVVRIKVRRR